MSVKLRSYHIVNIVENTGHYNLLASVSIPIVKPKAVKSGITLNKIGVFRCLVALNHITITTTPQNSTSFLFNITLDKMLNRKIIQFSHIASLSAKTPLACLVFFYVVFLPTKFA